MTDSDSYIRLTLDNYKLLLDNARREGAEQAREQMIARFTTRSFETATAYAEKIVKLQQEITRLKKELGND
jgi:hypothetical protein